MSLLTTDNYSLIFLLTPFHFLNVFGIFPFLLSQPWILRLFQKKDIFTRLRLANTCCSTYTNGSVALLSIVTVYFDEQTIRDPVFGTSALSRLTLLISMSFFVYDIIVLSLPLIRHHFFPEYSFNEMSKNDKSLENLKSDQAIPFKLLPIKLLLCREWDDKSPTERYSFIGHHLTAFMSFWWILANNQLLFFGCHRLMAELSTPILNAMVISENIPNLPPVIKDVLKISFSIIFISCRMFTAPFFWRLVYDTNWVEGISTIPRFLQILAPFLLDILNVFWAQKIIFKLIRALKRVENSVKYDWAPLPVMPQYSAKYIIN